MKYTKTNNIYSPIKASPYKILPLLAVATLVALPIAFFIFMYIVNTLVTLTQLFYARF